MYNPHEAVLYHSKSGLITFAYQLEQEHGTIFTEHSLKGHWLVMF